MGVGFTQILNPQLIMISISEEVDTHKRSILHHNSDVSLLRVKKTGKKVVGGS